MPRILILLFKTICQSCIIPLKNTGGCNMWQNKIYMVTEILDSSSPSPHFVSNRLMSSLYRISRVILGAGKWANKNQKKKTKELRGKSPCLLQITSKFSLTPVTVDFPTKFHTKALPLTRTCCTTLLSCVGNGVNPPKNSTSRSCLPPLTHQMAPKDSIFLLLGGLNNNHGTGQQLVQGQRAQNPCSPFTLYFIYLLFGKRYTAVFHYYLALTGNFKNSLSSPLQFCKGLSWPSQ